MEGHDVRGPARWRRLGLSVATAALAGGAFAPTTTAAQAAPTISFPTGKVQPGDAVDVIVSDCSALPTGTSLQQFSDVARWVDFQAQPDGTTWVLSFPAFQPPTGFTPADLELSASCDGVELRAYIDVDAPQMVIGPFIGPSGGSPPSTAPTAQSRRPGWP